MIYSKADLKRFRIKPESIEAVKVEDNSIVPIARWCGGRSFSSWVQVPTLEGVLVAELGAWVVKNGETGAFSVLSEEVLQEKYQQYGLRQDGLAFASLGTVSDTEVYDTIRRNLSRHPYARLAQGVEQQPRD